MNDFSRIYYWFFIIMLANYMKSQIIKEVIRAASVLNVNDNETFFLNDTFCLKWIRTRAFMTNNTYKGEQSPSMRIEIMWESNWTVSSLRVESDSQEDVYCRPPHTFNYHRLITSEKRNHTFPDLVNYGPRFIPVKLGCKYIIIPEMPFQCLPLKLKYEAPFCLSETVCSCRNVSLPGPDFHVLVQETGVMVHWEVPGDALDKTGEIKKISLSLQVSRPVNVDDIYPEEYIFRFRENDEIKSGSYFFPLNTTEKITYLLKGAYENRFECYGNITQLNFAFPEVKQAHNNVILYSISYILTITVIVLGIIYVFKRRQGQSLCNKVFWKEQTRQIHSADDDKIIYQTQETSNVRNLNNPLYYFDDNENGLHSIDYRELVLKKKIAEGHFGVVYLATSQSPIKGHNIFAVKQLKETASTSDVEDFLEEMNIFLKAGEHEHVVSLIGCHRTPPLSIIMEYVPYSLLEYLKNVRDEFEVRQKIRSGHVKNTPRKPEENLSMEYIADDEVETIPLQKLERVLDSQELESFGLQIAQGMAHLEEKSIVHRDLAARNILLDNKKTLKISDFGMSRSGIYVIKSNRQLPLRWMAPESITTGTFSNRSDVWAYGIVLWEIGTLGGLPYSDSENNEVFSLISMGCHPGQPENVTAPFFNLMLDCWSFKPEDRPTFAEIVTRIQNLRQKAYVDFASLREHYVFPPTEEDFKNIGDFC